MKKSEKIELRVGHAEKERLSKIASRRGQTVSDVVRDALAGELDAAPASFPKWPGYVAVSALGLSALSLIWLSVTDPLGANNGPVMSSADLILPDARNSVLETQVPHRDGFSQTYDIKTAARALQFTHDVTEISPDIFRLTTSLCAQMDNECKSVGEADIILASPSSPPRRGQVIARGMTAAQTGDEDVYLDEDILFVVNVLGPAFHLSGKDEE